MQSCEIITIDAVKTPVSLPGSGDAAVCFNAGSSSLLALVDAYDRGKKKEEINAFH